MDIEYRKLTENELETFIQMRIAQLREEGAKEDIDLTPALRDYYRRHMADGTFVSWLALDGEKIIGTSGMSIVEKPPYFGCPSGKIGLLSSMFTDGAYRRRGIAKTLLSKVVDEARQRGCGTVQITASDMGVLLYTDFGFVKNKNFMQYNECGEKDCRKGLFAEKIKPLGFTEFVRRYGKEELLDCLERNEKAGIVYHREGIMGDYDEFDDVEKLIEFIKTGNR